jgi:flagellar motor switch protein FliN/FliY
MSSTLIAAPAAELAVTAAATAAAILAGGQPLAAGDPVRDGAALESASHALLAQFTGAATGELVLVVDDDLATALQQSTIGPLDLVAALTPTFESIAVALGSVVLGALQEVDARLAVNRALQYEDSALVPLLAADDGAVRAGVAIGLAVPAAEPTPSVTSTGPLPSAERLDLLRGVEMDATAELGRARMTVNELLSLRNGAVIELDRVAGAPADLFVNGRLIARGEVVVVDENYGLRITQVVTDDTTAR